MNKKCVIFDLDGTLIDSLQGILDACNQTFEQLGVNIRKGYEEAKYFIGAGATVFAKRALGDKKVSPEKEKEIMDLFLENYGKTQVTSAKVFPGITEMLIELRNRGFYICIASNKPQVLLEPIVEHLFPNFKFDVAMGQMYNAPEKPNPFIIHQIEKKLLLQAKDCVYVGDSQYDVETALNAGLTSIIVKYGYGFYNQDWIKKADYVCENINQLKERLLN